ncbi:hypothetical protein RRF57_010763 [Xylaria bambusicola]|uniref:Uncharacterized protein n=1 Tax=Xylaria bambusicola TaxID=326684 RepID=A0AAN7UYK9_9PEZI
MKTPPSKKELAQSIVDLVRTSMIQILSLQPDLGTACMFGQALGELIIFYGIETFFKFAQAVHKSLRNILTTELAESSTELGDQRSVFLLSNSIIHSDILSTWFLGDVNGLNDTNFPRRLGPRGPSTHIRTVLFNSLGLFAGFGVLKSRDNLRANDNTISDSSDRLEVFARRDTKADSGGLVAAVFLHTLKQVGKVGVEGA